MSTSELEHRPSTERFFGGFGLAQMIASLATKRAIGIEYAGCVIRAGDPDSGPVDRESATAHRAYPCSCEYYAICDRIAHGERP